MRSSLGKILIVVSLCLVACSCSPEAKRARLVERAGKYFAVGEYDKAVVEFQNILHLDPQNSTANAHLGKIWLERGAPLRALPFLLKTKELSPGSYESRTNLAAAYLSLGKEDVARNEILSILGQSSSQGDALVLLTEIPRTKEQFEAAGKEVRKFFLQNNPSYHLASANLQLIKGDLPAARAALQRGLEVDSRTAALHSALGTVFLRQDDSAKANAEFKLAADLSPPRSTARMRYAEFQLQTGKVQDAVAYLKELIRQTPDFLSPRRLLAQIAQAEKKYDEAEAFLKDILLRDPTNMEAHLLQSQIFLAKAETKKAVDALERLSKAHPAIGVINHNFARALLQDNNPERAATVLREGLVMNPERADSIMLLAEINLRTGNPEPVLPAMALLLQKYPNMVQPQLLLVDALRQLGKLDEAVSVVGEQIRAYPNTPLPHMLLGSILRQQNKAQEAKQAFEHVLTMAPDYVAAANELVDIELAERDFESALRRSLKFWQKDPTSAEACFMEGRIYVAQGNWDRAEAALQKALEKNPALSAAYDLLIQTYVSGNRLPQAIAQLESGLERNPADPRALMLSGLIYEQMNDANKAKSAYERLLSARPDSVAALNNLACLYAGNINDIDRAHQLALKARELAPDSAAVADTLGWILFKRKDHSQAMALIAESAGKQPRNPEIQFHLGMASLALGLNEAARKALQIAASAPVEFRDKGEARRQLALLEERASEPGISPIQQPGRK